MFSLFIVLLSVSKSLATKCLILDDKPYMIRPTIIDMNHVEVKYYPFMISLNKCTETCVSNICIPKETNDINVKTFNMITNKDEAKAMTKHISYVCKYRFKSTTCNSSQKPNNKTCNVNVKIIMNANNSVTECDEVIIVMNNISTIRTNTMTTNVRSTAPMNCHSKKVRDCYILRTVLLEILLLLIITVICYHYVK